MLEVSRGVWGCGDVKKVVGVGKCLLPGGAVWVGWRVKHEEGCVVELRKEQVDGRLALRRVGVDFIGTGAVVGWSRYRRAGVGSQRDAVFAGSQAGGPALAERNCLVWEHCVRVVSCVG